MLIADWDSEAKWPWRTIQITQEHQLCLHFIITSVQRVCNLMNILFLYDTQTNSNWFYYSQRGLLRFTCTKKGHYDVSMLMFCFEYFSSVINSLLYSCNDKLYLKHDGKIQIRLIRAKRHLCNCWLIWLGFFIFMSQLEYLLQGLVVALVCLFPLLQAIAA